MNFKYIPASEPATGRWNMSYVPANMPGCVGAINNGYSLSPKYKLSWWEPNSFFQYNTMLISAYYGMKWKDNYRSYFNIPDDFILIGDSGGFQNMTMNANLNPIEVLRWQEKHCNIGLTFDLPLLEPDFQIRKDKMIQTAFNAKVAFMNRKNYNMKLFACFHGQTMDEQKFMIKEYEKHIPLEKFDGIAYGGLVASAGDTEFLIKILALFCYNVKHYNMPVHFFGLSGNKIMPYIKYISETFQMKITFDSSSYGCGAIRREFWKGNADEKIKVMETKFDKIPCDCPVCRAVKEWEVYREDGSIAGGLISLHNLYQTLQKVNQMQEMSKDENAKSLNPRFRKFIDIMKEHGPDNAFQIMDKIPENDTTQNSLFSY